MEEDSVVEEPPAKRARAVPCYADVDLGTWATKVKGKTSYGSPVVLIYDPQSSAPRLALSSRDQPRNFFPFGVDTEPLSGAPSFLSGQPDPSKTAEGLDLQITLLPEQLAFAERVDQWAQVQALAHSKEWFGQTHSAEEIAAMYTPCVKRDREERYSPKFKAKLLLSGFQPYLTKITFKAADGTCHSGAGWEFVEPLLGPDRWRGSEARAVVEFRRLWVVGKKFGIVVTYTDLVVVQKQSGEARPDFPELD